MNNLRNLVEQQKNQRALKIKNSLLKQTHVVKIAESLSPITKKLDEVKETTQKLRDVIKETNSNNTTPQLAIENTPPHQAIENNEGVIYDTELENTLMNMKKNNGFSKTKHNSESGWMLNNHPIKILRGTEVEINGNKYNITRGLQKVLNDKTYEIAKSMNDMDKVVLRDIL